MCQGHLNLHICLHIPILRSHLRKTANMNVRDQVFSDTPFVPVIQLRKEFVNNTVSGPVKYLNCTVDIEEIYVLMDNYQRRCVKSDQEVSWIPAKKNIAYFIRIQPKDGKVRQYALRFPKSHLSLRQFRQYILQLEWNSIELATIVKLVNGVVTDFDISDNYTIGRPEADHEDPYAPE